MITHKRIISRKSTLIKKMYTRSGTGQEEKDTQPLKIKHMKRDSTIFIVTVQITSNKKNFSSQLSYTTDDVSLFKLF